MIQLPTNHVFRRFVGSFVVAQRRSYTAPADSFEIQYKNAPYARGFAAWVVGQETEWETQESRCRKKANAPFSYGTKAGSLRLLLSVQTKRVVSLSCKCHPMLWDSAFWPVLIGVGIRRSRAGSVSQRAFAPDGREKFLDIALYGCRSAAG